MNIFEAHVLGDAVAVKCIVDGKTFAMRMDDSKELQDTIATFLKSLTDLAGKQVDALSKGQLLEQASKDLEAKKAELAAADQALRATVDAHQALEAEKAEREKAKLEADAAAKVAAEALAQLTEAVNEKRIELYAASEQTKAKLIEAHGLGLQVEEAKAANALAASVEASAKAAELAKPKTEEAKAAEP